MGLLQTFATANLSIDSYVKFREKNDEHTKNFQNPLLNSGEHIKTFGDFEICALPTYWSTDQRKPRWTTPAGLQSKSNLKYLTVDVDIIKQ